MVALSTSEVDYNNFIALEDYSDHFRLQIDFFAEIFKHVTVDLFIEFRIVKGSSIVARCLEIIHSEGFYPYLCVIDRNQQQIDVRLSFFNICLTDFNEFLTKILTL